MAGVPPPAVPLPPIAANVLAAPVSDDMPVVLDAAEALRHKFRRRIGACYMYERLFGGALLAMTRSL